MFNSLEEYRSHEIDAYGLSKYDRASDSDISLVTPFDSFLLQDALYLSICGTTTIMELKDKYKERFDSARGVFVVTNGDITTDYYQFATTTNRMQNKTYAGKVSNAANLLKRYIDFRAKNMTDSIKSKVDSEITNASEYLFRHIF